MVAAHVPRPGLTAALAASHSLPLVVVSAPAGTGKTTAVADWVRTEPGGTVCWVSFDIVEPAFWNPVLDSLREHGLGVPSSWSAPPGGLLGSRRLTALAGLVAGSPHRLIVVADGYELSSRELAREVDHLLRHSLGRLCFVFVGRVDPVLPLYRYRLTDSILEIRAPDLAFSDDEAALLLKSTGVELAHDVGHDLNERLSGWAAGLRFAARALVAREDAEEYAATVVEQTLDINEYLVAEVLDSQPPEVRRFLLDSCVTAEFCTDLVARVGGASAVHTMSDLVDRRAFVAPVPGHTGWFQYQPFFRSLLLAQLAYESPDRLVEVRRLASGWYRDHHRYAESLALLATIGAWQDLATQIVDAGLVGRLLLEEQGGPIGDLARRLPSAIDLPAASVVRAAAALRQGEAGKERCARELSSMRRTHGPGELDPCAVVAAAVTDAFRACLTDELTRAEEVVAEAERLLAGPPIAPTRESTSELESVVSYAGSVVALRRGDLAGARPGLSQAARSPASGVSAAFRADCLGHLAVAEALHGELAASVEHAEEALSIAGQAGLGTLQVPPSAHVALAWVGVERCDGHLTAEHVTAARSSRTLPADPFCSSLVEAATATLEQSSGQTAPALERLVRAADASARRDPWVADHLRVEASRLSLREHSPQRALAVLESVEQPDRPEVSVATAAACAEQGLPHSPAGLPVGDGAAPLGTQVRALLEGAAQTAQDRSPRQAAPVLSRAPAPRVPRTPAPAVPGVPCAPDALLNADPRLAQEHGWLHHARTRAVPSRLPDSGPGLLPSSNPSLPRSSRSSSTSRSS